MAEAKRLLLGEKHDVSNRSLALTHLISGPVLQRAGG
jgi:hypothetical protein